MAGLVGRQGWWDDGAGGIVGFYDVKAGEEVGLVESLGWSDWVWWAGGAGGTTGPAGLLDVQEYQIYHR
jgi:hypothetical protein